MPRNDQYQFVETDETIESRLIAGYEARTGDTVQPGSPVCLFLHDIAYVILLLLNQINYVGNQNIPSRAEGENLDALAELYYERTRPEAQPASCTVKFKIQEAQQIRILIPSGTRVTDASQTLMWETRGDTYIEIGETEKDLTVWCQTAGTIGNGYVAGQINRAVDIFDYYLECSNITESGGGSDVMDDDSFYEMLRASQDAYSTAGPVGAYVYHAKNVSSDIQDVVANSPNPGEVRIYCLTKSGEKANEELKKRILDACSADEVRPLTDKVLVEDAEEVTYNIKLTYYIQSDTTTSSETIANQVNAAVDAFVAWQSGKLGRDINPSRLISDIMKTGIKRIDLEEPTFTVLKDGVLDFAKTYQLSETIPQIAKLGERTVTNGGFEDE